MPLPKKEHAMPLATMVQKHICFCMKKSRYEKSIQAYRKPLVEMKFLYFSRYREILTCYSTQAYIYVNKSERTSIWRSLYLET